jgi:hypothetical protein
VPIPTPEPGLVISYAYLWHHERKAGREEGRKDRPSVIVLAVERPANDTTIVLVLPITHIAPADSAAAIEIPAAVKSYLGLDDERSWIVVAKGNEFDWPGYDLPENRPQRSLRLWLLATTILQAGHRGLRRMASSPQSDANLARVICGRKSRQAWHPQWLCA